MPATNEFPRVEITLKKPKQLIGKISRKELLPSLNYRVHDVIVARVARTAAVFSLGTAGTMSGFVAAEPKIALLAVPMSIISGHLTDLTNRRVRKATFEAGFEVNRRKEFDDGRIKRFIDQGATHVFFDRKGNLHFVKHEKMRGKWFRPIFGRMHTPLERDSVI